MRSSAWRFIVKRKSLLWFIKHYIKASTLRGHYGFAHLRCFKKMLPSMVKVSQDLNLLAQLQANFTINPRHYKDLNDKR